MSDDSWVGFVAGCMLRFGKTCLLMTCLCLTVLAVGADQSSAQTACPIVTGDGGGNPLNTGALSAVLGGCISTINGAALLNTVLNETFSAAAAHNIVVLLTDSNPFPASGGNRPAIFFSPTGGLSRSLVSVTCDGATAIVSGVTLARVTLDDNTSCPLNASAPAGTGGATLTYQATLSRVGDEYSVSAGTITGAPYGGVAGPEIDINGNGASITDNDATPSAADNTDFGIAPVDGGTITRTFTINNSGIAPLNLTSNPRVGITGANAADFTVTADATTPVAQVGGTTTFTISFDPSAVGTRTATVTVNNDDADEVAYSFAIQGTGTGSSTGSVTLIKNTSPVLAGDGTFTFASDAGGLNGLSLATSGNSATSAAITVNAGNVSVTEDVIPGWKLSSIACTGDADSGSVIDVANRKVTIDVDANEAIVCTFTNVRDAQSVIRETHRVISNFMSERADVIVANDPDLSDRFLTGGSNGQGNPLGFAARGDIDDIELSFATSLRAMRQAANAEATRNVEGIGADPSKEVAARFDIWAKGTYARVDSTDRKSDVGLLHTGFDYRFSDNLLLGLMGQIDWTDQRERSTNTNTSADGVGWLIGPYLAARLHQNLILDGRAAWGQSYNQVNPLGLYTDDFNTNRWLVRGQLTGDFAWGKWTFNPSVGISYFSETQKSYVDSLSITIPSQTITLGRAQAGPEIRYTLHTKDGWQFAPHFGVKGIWDFDPANIVTAQGVTIDSSGLRARTEGGTVLVMPWGWSLNGVGFYDGIGAQDFQSYGGSVKVNVPLN